MSRYAMVLDPARCVDCKACMVACTAENDVPVGKHRNWVRSDAARRFPGTVDADRAGPVHAL